MDDALEMVHFINSCVTEMVLISRWLKKLKNKSICMLYM